MKPYESYQHQRTFGWTRIDMLLALYDGAISRLEKAREALARRDRVAAAALLLRSERIVIELLSGLDLSYGELPKNLQRLYTFVLQSIASGTENEVGAAIEVLRTLRSGLAEIQPEAAELERSGQIPPADSSRSHLQAIG